MGPREVCGGVVSRVRLTPRQTFLLMVALTNPHGTVYVPSHDHGTSSIDWTVEGKKVHVRNVLGYGLQEANGLVKRGLMTEQHSVYTVTELGRAALALRSDLVADLIALSEADRVREAEAADAADRAWEAEES